MTDLAALPFRGIALMARRDAPPPGPALRQNALGESAENSEKSLELREANWRTAKRRGGTSRQDRARAFVRQCEE